MFKKFYHLSLLNLIFWSFALPAVAEELSRSLYKGSYSGITLSLTRTLSTQAQGYELSSTAKNLLGSLQETSQFNLDKGRLKPQQYLFTRSVLGKKSQERLMFNWPKNTADYSRQDKPQHNTQHPLTPFVLDPTLYQLAFQADLFNRKKQLQYTFIKRQKKETYTFIKTGEQLFTINKKNYTAWVYERAQADKGQIWVIPDLEFQIAKIIFKDDKSQYELTLVQHSANSQAMHTFYKQLN